MHFSSFNEFATILILTIVLVGAAIVWAIFRAKSRDEPEPEADPGRPDPYDEMMAKMRAQQGAGEKQRQ
jgi:hypothetical protein